MKQLKIFSILSLLIIMFASQSCRKGILEGINDNPNLPTSVTPRVLLPGAQGNLAYAQGGDVERFTGIMMQYVTGGSRQFFGYNNYVFTEEDFNNLWYNMYAGTMENFRAIINIEKGSPGTYSVYDGIAKVMMAYSLGMTTDLWGDIPYSQAFQGNLELTPDYDGQDQIYATLQSLLDEAITEMTDDPGDDFDYPDNNDFVYSGDVTSWISLAHALKARFYIHLTKVDANAAQNALNEITAGGEIADAGFKFAAGATTDNPWFQYIDQRDDILYIGSSLDTMIARNDPRYGIYIDVNGDQGHWDVGYLGAFFQGQDATVYFMTNMEQDFIEAEAKSRMGDMAGAQEALQEAISTSFTFYGLDGTDSATAAQQTAYLDTYGTLTGDFNTDLQTIMTEKWIADYLSPESWTDWRRTGYPVLTPNVAGLEIPRRFIYPTNEHLYNPQPSLPNGGDNLNSTMYEPRLWWDQ
ncbi:MAG: SusD/RagB family nutrient-binding outer membrane lipoprotein [Chitinophagales bacterium]